MFSTNPKNKHFNRNKNYESWQWRNGGGKKKGVVRKCGCARNQVWAVPALVSVRLPGRALHALLQLGGR